METPPKFDESQIRESAAALASDPPTLSRVIVDQGNDTISEPDLTVLDKGPSVRE